MMNKRVASPLSLSAAKLSYGAAGVRWPQRQRMAHLLPVRCMPEPLRISVHRQGYHSFILNEAVIEHRHNCLSSVFGEGKGIKNENQHDG